MTSSFSSPPSQSHSDLSSLPSSVSEVVRDDGRLEALSKQNILDTDPEPAFDRITRLAGHLLDVPTSIINFVAEDRQWFKSAVGFDEKEISLDISFCVYTLEKGEVLVVEDLAKDERFKNNPLVTEQGVRFYAGAPLITPDGKRLGTLCVLDTKPRDPSPEVVDRLADLAEMVVDELELRKEMADAERARQRLAESRELLQHSQELAEVGGWSYDVSSEELT